ncbi:MAG: carbonic anhydrase, partial [Candidatus Micrarchaeota archaeon]
MANHTTQKPPKEAIARSKKPVFPAGLLLSTSRLVNLRKKHTEGVLSAEESEAFILAGNAGHAAAVKEASMSPRERFEKIKAGEADYLIIRCSDARVHKSDSETDSLVGMHVYIAGNVVPGGHTVSQEELVDALSLLRPGGVVVVEGHCHCGAVAECVKWTANGKGRTGSEPLDHLLQEIVGSTPESNAMGQHEKLRKVAQLLDKQVVCMMYDWDRGTIDVLDKGSSDLVQLLSDSFALQHKKADPDGKLGQKIAKQKPHAIAIAYSQLPFSVSTITRAEQNEIFNTTGSEGGLDDFDAASILYAVSHLKVRHIPFIAPLTGGKPGKVSKMFDKWEADLRAMTVDGEPMMAKMLDSGELKISRLGYDLDTGVLKTL